MYTSDAAIDQVKGIALSFNNAAKNKIDELKAMAVVNYRNTSEVTEIFNSREGMSGAKELGETEKPPVASLGEGYQVTLSEKRFGQGIEVPQAVWSRWSADNTVTMDEYLQEQRNQLLLTNIRLMETNAALMLNEAHLSTSAYLAPDSVEVCGAHTWNSGATFDNSKTKELSEEAADDAEEYAGAFTDAHGKDKPLNWTHIVVKKGSAAAKMAKQLYASDVTPTSISDVNVYQGALTVVETPKITTTNKKYHFFFDLSEEKSPLYVGVGSAPSLQDPQKLPNESILTNCTGFWKQGVANMPYQILGSTGETV